MPEPKDPVRAQYEAYPYPARDPKDEKRRLIEGSPSHILEIDHYVFGGRRDWRRPFRALIAGGGTGDAAIMLAQQLADRAVPARIRYVDVSAASLAIAKARAEARGLANVEFETGTIEALAGEPVDYIDCCGVLHHLEDPAAGLMRLVGMLKPDGGIGLMVYAPLGRTGVYPMQELVRQLGDGLPDPERIRLARKLFAQLPPTNWLKRNPFVGDHLRGDDAGLYDLLMHRRDRAYGVPELARLIDAAGLKLSSFIEPARYEPGTYLRDPALIRLFEPMPAIERAAAAERIAGNLSRHVLYAVLKENSGPHLAAPDSRDAVPILKGVEAEELAQKLKPSGTLNADADHIELSFPLPPLAPAIARRIDGRRTLGEIHADLAREVAKGLDQAGFERQFRQFYAAFNGLNKLVLRCAPP